MVDSAHAHLEQGWPLTKAKMRWAQIAELSLSLFLSAGHRGRRDDPQALGPPDHPLFSLSLSLSLSLFGGLNNNIGSNNLEVQG